MNPMEQLIQELNTQEHGKLPENIHIQNGYMMPTEATIRHPDGSTEIVDLTTMRYK